jgi:hypothetical protein
LPVASRTIPGTSGPTYMYLSDVTINPNPSKCMEILWCWIHTYVYVSISLCLYKSVKDVSTTYSLMYMSGQGVKVCPEMFSQPATCCVMPKLHPYNNNMTVSRLSVWSNPCSRHIISLLTAVTFFLELVKEA